MSEYISFGTWKLPYEDTADIISNAVAAGFRHFDTAAAYANESAVGDGLLSCGMPREALFVSGKLWTTKRGFEAAMKSCKKSLRNLRLDYFDQYLIHWPATAATDDDWVEINRETWGALEQLKKDGWVRRIGVCNCSVRELEALIDGAEIAPEINQLEFHPGFMQAESVEFCKARGISLEAWSALGHGSLLTDPTVLSIAESLDRTPAQVILRWCLEKGISPITKTVSPQRMRENLDVSGFKLDAAVIAALDNINGGASVNYDEFLKRS